MNVQIREVANGWEVTPGYDPSMDRDRMVAHNEVHVFNDFTALTEYLLSISPLIKKRSQA